jgi:hypothetical protein
MHVFDAVYTIAAPYGIDALTMAREKIQGLFREFVPCDSG